MEISKEVIKFAIKTLDDNALYDFGSAIVAKIAGMQKEFPEKNFESDIELVSLIETERWNRSKLKIEKGREIIKSRLPEIGMVTLDQLRKMFITDNVFSLSKEDLTCLSAVFWNDRYEGLCKEE